MQRGQFAGTFYDVRCSNTGTPRGGAGAKGTPSMGGARAKAADSMAAEPIAMASL